MMLKDPITTKPVATLAGNIANPYSCLCVFNYNKHLILPLSPNRAINFECVTGWKRNPEIGKGGGGEKVGEGGV